MIKILIADDHTMFREGLKHILAEYPDVVVTDEANNGQEVLDKIWKNDYDMVLLDITMPGMTGLEALKQLKNDRPKLPVLILSMHPEEQYAIRVLRAGASGYLTKESAPDELITAIRKISQGRKYITPSLAERLASEFETDSEKPLHDILSDREYQVLRMIAEGKTGKHIAKELSLSIKTVSTYRTRIMEKMNMKTNAEVMHYVIKHQLLD
ncbi:MAG: response regulator transcription factor [Candidatus Atribacteria bacterium]|jgi:DNA-binding NarL/FixJ family response regulator|nr:MAG: response regulator transcription factor [Candidatus Atribacteria bacterium]